MTVTAMNLGKEVLTIVHAVLVVDPFDQSQSRDWINATRTDVPGCNVQPFRMSNKLVHEDNLQREFVFATFRVWLPADTKVFYTDHAVWRGEEMEILGPPQLWTTLEGVPHHIQMLMELKRG